MRALLQSDYFPYGSQYYRAPSPPPEDWEADLAQMAGLGFNMVKFWAQWRWNHPEEDRFYFDDLDRLMDLSAQHGLKVMLNTIVDVAPAWIYRKYPDASMVTLDGRQIGPQTQPHRQIGGLGLCLCHEAAVAHLYRFLEATVERYRDHPALAIWNVGSEPELTQSMAEMRLWADDAAKIGDMLDFNPHAIRAFKRWLEHKYGGDVARLNLAWNRNYTSFDEAEVPKTRNTFNDVIDWRMFFVHVLGENVRRRFEVAARVDGGRHPLMCHHVFVQGFPVTSTASDPWNVGQYGDLHGFTQMDDPMMHDILRSCARGKPVMSAEMLMLMGYTLNLPRAIDADDVKRHVFTGVAANLKGFLFWQYRPEMLGREAPTWGLSHLDGSTTPWLEDFAKVGRVLEQNRDFLFEATPRPAEVAIVYNPENQIFAWAATGNEKTATDSLLGVHRALYDASFPVDFLHPKDFAPDVLDGYRVIVVPFPYLLSEVLAARLKAWVAAGGVLVAEAYCGGWDLEHGRHHTTIPGYGLHEVFGVRQRNAEPAQDHGFLLYHGTTRRTGGASVRAGLNEAVPGAGFVVAQPYDPTGGLGQVEITLARDLPGLARGAKVYGAMVKETFFVDGAEVIATYADGQAAITKARYGQGQAILIGSYVGLAYQRLGYASNAALLAALVDAAVAVERPRVSGGLAVRVDVLRAPGGEAMVVVQNNTGRAVDATIRLPEDAGRSEQLPETFVEQFGGPAAVREGRLMTVSLKPKEVRVYRG